MERTERYVRIRCENSKNMEFYMGVRLPSARCYDVMMTALNKACLATSMWGYTNYNDLWEKISEVCNSGHVDIDLNYVFSIEIWCTTSEVGKCIYVSTPEQLLAEWGKFIVSNSIYYSESCSLEYLLNMQEILKGTTHMKDIHHIHT